MNLIRSHESRVRYPGHYKIFIPGYELHQCLQVSPTYNGLPNTDGCTQEYLIDKIESFERFCWQIGELIDMINSELYSMQIPHDCGLAWSLMKTVYCLCRKMAIKYTECQVLPGGDLDLDNTLDCVREVKGMLEHLKYCSRHNPRDNITPSSLNLMMRLMRKAKDTMQSFLRYIERTHRNVAAE